MAPLQLLLTTFPDIDTAHKIASILLEKQLIACANLLPGARSLYHWEGQLQDQPEVLALLKTTPSHLPALRDTLQQLHPYQIPELLTLDAHSPLPDYLHWLQSHLSPNPSPKNPS